MSIFSKLMFWKKKDEFADFGLGDKGAVPGMNLGLGPELGAGAELTQGTEMQPSLGMPMQQPPIQQPAPFQAPAQPPFQSPAQPQMQGQEYTNSKNLEVISSKLDALRASLDSINQRLANIENIARSEEEQRYKKRW